ncbi:aldehyde dehydrogenase family protein [Rhizobium wenxiniae]|uniref:aldehyde dehydrogenase family protein n=1 Tax=Rhizobium wenxiniae TaxID=1737357 RepID=UPI001CB78ACB|nr:aldehyde dehydrogenase family protein [Rhizobium wenxiniae]
MISDISTWNRKHCKQSTTRSARGCHPCLRYKMLPMSSVWTEVIPSENPARTMIAIRKPSGVVVSIVPWNAPALLVGASVPAALVLGNTVVIKASEQTPRTHCLVAACFVDAGFPSGVVNLIANAPENASGFVEALIAHPSARRIHFTGSTRIGRIIAEKAGTYLKRTVLELGGKAPVTPTMRVYREVRNSPSSIKPAI